MRKSVQWVAERYLSERIVTRPYAKRVRAVAAGCGKFDEDACNRYLKRRVSEVASVTVAPERVLILSLWRYAYERRLIDSMPRGIVKIKVSRPPVRAWTIEQCCTAVKATFPLDPVRTRTGASLGRFLRCWLLLGYETGARQGDLWRMCRQDFAGGTVSWTQAKTGVPHTRDLSPRCMEAVRVMLKSSPDGRVLGYAMSKESAYKRMRAHLRRCKMSGSSKWLRRSGCTHIEIGNPGRGRHHLGHKTIGLAERHYIDWGQVNRDVPKVPVLLE